MDRGCRCTNMSGHAAIGNPFIRAAGRGRSMSISTAMARLLPALYGYTAGYLLERVKGRYRVLDSTGAVIATLPKAVTTAERAGGGAIIATAVDPETGRETASLYSAAGRRLTKQPLQRIGGFEAGLAPFLQDGRLGLLAETGKIVSPATWPVGVEPEDHFLLFEGLLAVNTGGYISIIRVEQK